MPRDEGWHFVQLGLFLERAAGTARLLTCQMREARPVSQSDDALDEQLEWICLLKACDALELYRRRCGATMQPDRIVHFLIADQLSPCSLRYALDEISRALTALAAAAPNERPVTLPTSLTSAVDSMGPGAPDPTAVVSAIETECHRVHSSVNQTYIDHRRPAAPMA